MSYKLAINIKSSCCSGSKAKLVYYYYFLMYSWYRIIGFGVQFHPVP